MNRLSSGATHNASAIDSSKGEQQNQAISTNGKPHGESSCSPELLHRFTHDTSILCLTTDSARIFAGTQAGEILVFTLDTYQRETIIKAHHGSVLGLCLSEDKKLLFSSAGDRQVNIWDAVTLEHRATIYSLYDVGDIFCISYSQALNIAYMGCQNTSIQWYDLTSYSTQPSSDPRSHPSLRQDRFFDSPGPGGIRNPNQRASSRGRLKQDAHFLEIPQDQLHQFAHFGYVHCMLLARSLSGVNHNQTLITAGGDGAVCLWSVSRENKGRPRLAARLEDDREDAASIQAFALEGNFLFTGRVDGEINVWDLETKQFLRGWKAFKEDVLSLTLLPRALLATSDSGDAQMFNTQYESTQRWKAHDGRVLASAFSNYRKQASLITGGSDNSLAVWRYDSDVSSPTSTTHEQEEELLDSLRAFIAHKTVSSDPRYKPDCRRGASYLRSLLRKLGATTEMIATEQQCNPIVLGKFRNTNPSTAGKRILFYGHYDVIAAENKQGLWIQDPFTMTGQDGFLYGRGTSDNKGPIMAAIYAVADIARAKQLRSDIVFLLEGEEECGSRGFENAIRKHKNLIGDVDCIIFANSYWLDDETPCLTYGLRGVLHATVHVESDLPDLHSGVDGSRSLDEPLKDLCMLTASLTGPKGVINVPGFDECIRPLAGDETRLYQEVATSMVKSNPKLGDVAKLTQSLKQRWREPSLTIHGFKTSGSEKSTIIPHTASVALSMRLVPNQESCNVAKSLESYLQQQFDSFDSRNTLTVRVHHTAEPWLGDPTNDLFKALEDAVKAVWTRRTERRESFSLSSPTINPSHIRQRRTSATPARRPYAPATSTNLASGNLSPDEAANDTATSTVERHNRTSASHGNGSTLSEWRPLYIREGGSIPAIRFLEKEFDAPAAQLPCGQASDNAHLDNERLRVINLLNAREIFRRVFAQLSGT